MNKIGKIESRFLDPLTDFGFHRLFGAESSKKFLINFLNEIIREGGLITDIQYLPPNQQGFTEKERKAVFDIFCTNENGEYLIVEMQRAGQTYFRDRSLFYASLPIQKQAPQGTWNFQLKAVYLVAVLDFVIFDEFAEDKDQVVEYVSLMRERTKSSFSKKRNFIFVELPKLTKKEMKEYKKSVLEYRDVRDSLEFAREEAGKEGWKQGLKDGREQGLKEGREEGREQEKISIILKCFQKNMPVEDIIFLTGFSKERIIRLISDASN